jgi:hypothetical protein
VKTSELISHIKAVYEADMAALQERLSARMERYIGTEWIQRKDSDYMLALGRSAFTVTSYDSRTDSFNSADVSGAGQVSASILFSECEQVR